MPYLTELPLLPTSNLLWQPLLKRDHNTVNITASITLCLAPSASPPPPQDLVLSVILPLMSSSPIRSATTQLM